MKPEYRELKLLDVTYGELMTTPVEVLRRSVGIHTCHIPSAKKAMYILSLLEEAGLGSVTLGQTLAQMEGAHAALIRWISMFVNRISDIGIIADHWKELDQKTISFLKKTASEWRKTNPVWFI